jgi:molybdopterin-guanine dinucleotide biosynthesis protein A
MDRTRVNAVPRMAPFSRAILGVLAGGRSSRFGASKLLLHWRGEPILAWQARNLRGWAHAVPGVTRDGGANAWLNLPAAQADAPPSSLPPGSECYDRIIRDAESFAGPLAGIAAILEAGDEDDLIAIVPADMPLITPAHLSRLLGAWLSHAGARPAIVMSRWVSGPSAGRVEPLPSLWHVGRARPLVNERLKQGMGPSGLAELPDVIAMPLGEPDRPAWDSINTPEDLARMAGF